MVLVTVVQSQLEEVGKIVDIMGEQDNVVCLANSSYLEVPNAGMPRPESWAFSSCSLL